MVNDEGKKVGGKKGAGGYEKRRDCEEEERIKKNTQSKGVGPKEREKKWDEGERGKRRDRGGRGGKLEGRDGTRR